MTRPVGWGTTEKPTRADDGGGTMSKCICNRGFAINLSCPVHSDHRDGRAREREIIKPEDGPSAEDIASVERDHAYLSGLLAPKADPPEPVGWVLDTSLEMVAAHKKPGSTVPVIPMAGMRLHNSFTVPLYTHPPSVEPGEWLSEMSESDVAGCHEITPDKPNHPDYDHGLHLRHRRLVGPWMVYDGDGKEVVAEDQSHRTCVSIDHCAARNASVEPGAAREVEGATPVVTLTIDQQKDILRRASNQIKDALAMIEEAKRLPPGFMDLLVNFAPPAALTSGEQP